MQPLRLRDQSGIQPICLPLTTVALVAAALIGIGPAAAQQQQPNTQ